METKKRSEKIKTKVVINLENVSYIKGTRKQKLLLMKIL